MTKCMTCVHSKFNNEDGSWCKYSPSPMHDSYPGDCRDGSRYESIYTIEPTIVLGNRYYTPLVESGMYETEPIVFQMEE